MRQLPSQAILLAAVAMLCFAANSLVCRMALAPGSIDAATFTTLRVLSAGTMLGGALYLSRRQLPQLALVNLRSTMALLGYLIFFSFAYVRLDAGSGALVLIGAVQITMFGIAFHEGERFRPSQWTGLGLALFGFIFLILPGVSAPDPFGAVLMFLSGFSWGCFSLFARGVPDPVAANASNFLVCLLPVGLINLLIGHPFETAPAGVLLAVISGGIATGFGYIFWYLAVRDLPVTHAATVQLSLPALVALGGVVFLSEPITARLLVASMAMLGGIALVLGRRSKLQTAS
jgi:drug/metabolite transporter (DMT)-like permease